MKHNERNKLNDEFDRRELEVKHQLAGYRTALSMRRLRDDAPMSERFFEYIDADGQYRRLPCNPLEEEPPMPSLTASLLTLFRRSLFALLLLSACALAFTAAFRLRQARAELEETGTQLDKTNALLLRYKAALDQANANIDLQNQRIQQAGPYVEALQKKAADAAAAENAVKMACGWHDV